MSIICLGILILNIIGTNYVVLEAGYIGLATVPVFLSVSFVFLTGVLFRSSSLVSTSAVLVSVLLVDTLQLVLALESILTSRALTGYVMLWVSSVGILLCRYLIADAGTAGQHSTIRPSAAIGGPAQAAMHPSMSTYDTLAISEI